MSFTLGTLRGDSPADLSAAVEAPRWRQQLWLAYSHDIQRAWRDQLVPDRLPPDFDPDTPF